MTSLRSFLSAAFQQAVALSRRFVFVCERQRRTQVLVAFVICGIVAMATTEAVITQRRARNTWTTQRSVLVTTTPLQSGDTLTKHNTRLISLPLALIPADAYTSLPRHRHSRIALDVNTPLTRSVTVPSSEAVVVPDGWRVVALPSDIPVPRVHIGDQVDVVSSVNVIAANCIVMATSPMSVAAPLDRVPQIVAVSRLGELAVVVAPQPSPTTFRSQR